MRNLLRKNVDNALSYVQSVVNAGTFLLSQPDLPTLPSSATSSLLTLLGKPELSLFYRNLHDYATATATLNTWLGRMGEDDSSAGTFGLRYDEEEFTICVKLFKDVEDK